MDFTLNPVGIVHSSRSEADDDNWDSENSKIELIPPFDDQALRGLTDFSHCIVVYVFDQASWDESKMVRHPRGNKDWPKLAFLRNEQRIDPIDLV